MRGDDAVGGHDLTYILVAVMRIEIQGIAAVPSKRASRNRFRTIPSVNIAAIIRNLQIRVVEESLIVLLTTATHVVIGHGDE